MSKIHLSIFILSCLSLTLTTAQAPPQQGTGTWRSSPQVAQPQPAAAAQGPAVQAQGPVQGMAQGGQGPPQIPSQGQAQVATPYAAQNSENRKSHKISPRLAASL